MKSPLTSSLKRITFAAACGTAVYLGGLSVASASFANMLAPAEYYAVLALNGNVQQSGPLPPSGANQNNIQGNVGVASSGFKYQGSGSVNVPTGFDIHTGSTFSTSSSGLIGPVNQNAAADARLEAAKSAAFATSSFYASQTATASYGAISGNFNITQSAVGNYVFNISSISLSNTNNITLSAPAGSCFVLNITGGFSLSGSSHISLAGGLTPANVLYNVLGTGNVAFSGGGNSSGIDGILLAVNRSIQISPGLINGAVIGQDISMSSGASVIGVVPEVNAGLMIPGFIGLVVLASSSRLLRRKVAVDDSVQ